MNNMCIAGIGVQIRRNRYKACPASEPTRPVKTINTYVLKGSSLHVPAKFADYAFIHLDKGRIYQVADNEVIGTSPGLERKGAPKQLLSKLFDLLKILTAMSASEAKEFHICTC